jgi:hypothetical protein
MHSLIRSIPAFKWLLVLPQLTSRMCHVQPDVQVGATGLQLTNTTKVFAVRTHAHVPNFRLSQLWMVDGLAGCTFCVDTYTYTRIFAQCIHPLFWHMV